MKQLVLIDVSQTPHCAEIYGKRIRRNIDKIIEKQKREEIPVNLPTISIKKTLLKN